MTIIPPITDPLGAYWKQPTSERILVDDTHALMDEAAFKSLAEYSASIPTGVYFGKMWKAAWRTMCRKCARRTGSDPVVWYLRWYEPCEDPKQAAIPAREILLA